MKKRIVLVAVISAALFFSCEEYQTKGPKFLTEEEQAVTMEDAAFDNVIEAMDNEVNYYTSSREIISGINGTKKNSQRLSWHYKDGAPGSIFYFFSMTDEPMIRTPPTMTFQVKVSLKSKTPNRMALITSI